MEDVVFESPNCKAAFKVETQYLGVNRMRINCPNCDLVFQNRMQ